MSSKKAVPVSQLLAKLYENIPTYEAYAALLQAELSASIAKARIDRNMNQQQFAEFMGVTQSQVSKWENEDYNFTIRKLCEIADKLGMTFDASLKTHISENVKCNTYSIADTGNVIYLASYQGTDGWSGKSFSSCPDPEILKEM